MSFSKNTLNIGPEEYENRDVSKNSERVLFDIFTVTFQNVRKNLHNYSVVCLCAMINIVASPFRILLLLEILNSFKSRDYLVSVRH
jgi:hypothetical protein